MKILLIDDEEIFLQLCEEYLQENFKVMTANTAIKAYRLLETEKPSAIVLDWNMPGISGRQILKKIRSNSKFDFVPIIVLSGSDLYSTKNLSYQEGADDYMEKPVLPDLLRQRIYKLIDEQSFSRQLTEKK